MKKNGFTLIELLVVMGTIGLLVVIAMPTYNNMRNGVSIRNQATDLINSLRVVQQRSMISQDGTVHGIHFNSDNYVIYGGSWAAPTYTETISLGNNIQITQGAGLEVEFNRLTGRSSDLEIKVGIPGGSDTRVINITQSGRIYSL